MDDVAIGGALAVAVLNGLVGAWGAWRWWRVEPSRVFWLGARAGQALAGLYAITVGVLLVAGWRPGAGLFWLYALLPVAIGAVAEQLRILSAETVIEQRGHEGIEDVRRLPESEQRSIVVGVMRREMGVIALAALVVCFLALRAVVEA